MAVGHSSVSVPSQCDDAAAREGSSAIRLVTVCQRSACWFRSGEGHWMTDEQKARLSLDADIERTADCLACQLGVRRLDVLIA